MQHCTESDRESSRILFTELFGLFFVSVWLIHNHSFFLSRQMTCSYRLFFMYTSMLFFFITSSKKPYNLSNVHQKNAVQLLFLWRVCFSIINVIKPASIICSWDSMEQLSIAQFRLQFSNCKNFCNSQMIKEHLVQKHL